MKNSQFAAMLAITISCSPTLGKGQGLLYMGNTTTTRFSTNAFATGGGSGFTLPGAGPWYFELLTAPSNVVSVDPSLQSVLSAPWSDTGVQGTNTVLPGRLTATVNGATANFWPAGQTNSFIIIGWSANLGSTWAALAPKLFGASLLPAGGGNFAWSGGQLESTSDGLPGFLGATTVGFRQAGGIVGGFTIPTPSLFSAGNDSQGNPVITPTTLWTTIPEPSILALGCPALALSILGKRPRR